MKNFYIIAHNPDTIDQMHECLRHGANALGPDIALFEGRHWVYDQSHQPTKPVNAPSLEKYCGELAKYLLDTHTDLGLIVWDMKNVDHRDFDFVTIKTIIMEQLVDVLEQRGYGSIPMLFSHADDHNYILHNVTPHLLKNWAVGIDGINDPKKVVSLFKETRVCYGFADGTSFPLGNTLNYMDQIKQAIELKSIDPHLSLVYPWTVNSKLKMKKFIEAGVDGIITDEVKKLHELVTAEFKETIKLAGRHDNPFLRHTGEQPATSA